MKRGPTFTVANSPLPPEKRRKLRRSSSWVTMQLALCGSFVPLHLPLCALWTYTFEKTFTMAIDARLRNEGRQLAKGNLRCAIVTSHCLAEEQ